MIDLFVLLIPLVLLPIIFMLSFVGCGEILGLDKFGPGGRPVHFNYNPTLDNYIDTIDVTWTGAVAFINEDLEPEFKEINSFLNSIQRSDTTSAKDVQHATGEFGLEAGSIPHNSIDGNIKCHCNVIRKVGNEVQPILVPWRDKPILANMPAPSFTLTPDGYGGFNII